MLIKKFSFKRSLCIGFLLVFLAGMTSFYSAETKDNSRKEQKQNKASGESGTELHKLSFEALIPILGIDIPVFTSPKIRIPQSVIYFVPDLPRISLRSEYFFKTLFNNIISINAP